MPSIVFCSQQTFVGLFICWFISMIFWRHYPDMCWRRLHSSSSITIFCLSRRLEDVLKTSCKCVLNTYLKGVLKICLRGVLKTCLEDGFETSWRQTKCLLGISVSNKSECVSNKSMFHKYIYDELTRMRNH